MASEIHNLIPRTLHLNPQQEELDELEAVTVARAAFVLQPNLLKGIEAAPDAVPAVVALPTAVPEPESELPIVDAHGFMKKLSHRMCLIQREDGSESTGFLVGPDLMLTAAHTLRGTAGIFADPDQVTILFDRFEYVESVEEVPRGAECRLKVRTSNDGPKQPDVVASSIEVDSTGRKQTGDNGLDYILVRLDTQIGKQPVADERRRGWNDCHIANDGPAGRVRVVQHPFGGVLRFARGEIMPGAVEHMPGHFRYHSRTFNGSSGAPVFNDKFRVVAIHVGEREEIVRGKAETVQLGVSFQTIFDDLHAKGVALPPF